MAKIALVDSDVDTGSRDLAPVQRKIDETVAEASPPQPAAKPVAERPQAPLAEAPVAPAAAAPAKPRSKRRFILAGVALIAIAAGSYFGHEWWTTGRFIVSTDDAYIGADATTVAPRISGYVAKVTAPANGAVKLGDPLVYLDDSDQRLAITAAENQIASQEAALTRIDRQIAAAKAGVAQAQSAVTSADAAVASAEAGRELASADLDRATKLNESQFASRQSLDQAKAASDKAIAAVDSANAAIDSAKAGVTSAGANVDVLVAQRVEAERALDQYRTALDQKKLDLERTVIRAPFDGVVGNRAVDPGEFVAAGQRLLALVPLSQVYIDANFKETQLAEIRPGAKAMITVDAASGGEIEGTVDSVAPASGSVFSLLPPDNATGNFTKITQRVPVRIHIPADAIAKGDLRPGLSVTVAVDSRTGQGAPAL